MHDIGYLVPDPAPFTIGTTNFDNRSFSHNEENNTCGYDETLARELEKMFDQDAESGAAAYFNVVWRNLLAKTFRDELPEDLWPAGGSRWVAAVTELLSDPRNGWWDDLNTADVVEDRDDILRQSLLDARDEMTARQALDRTIDVLRRRLGAPGPRKEEP